MKKLTLASLIITNVLFSQSKIELPLKNEMILFQTDYKSSNQSKCLSKYFENIGVSFNSKLTPVINQIFKVKGLNSNDYSGFLTIVHDQFTLNCADTISGGSMLFSINIPLTTKLLTSSQFLKKKINSQLIKSDIQIIFKDKNNYSIKFKGFIYQCSYFDGGTLVNKEFPLEECYLEYKENNEELKNLTKFYSDLQIMVLEAHKLINANLEKMFKADDI